MAINNIKRSVHRLLLVDDQPILRRASRICWIRSKTSRFAARR